MSCAAAIAVLSELQKKRKCRPHRRLTHERLISVAAKYSVIGDVRQSGMVFRVEFVIDGYPAKPATAFADLDVNRMRQRGIVLSKLGTHKNTLKIRPPMTFAEVHLYMLISVLDDVLHETTAQLQIYGSEGARIEQHDRRRLKMFGLRHYVLAAILPRLTPPVNEGRSQTPVTCWRSAGPEL